MMIKTRTLVILLIAAMAGSILIQSGIDRRTDYFAGKTVFLSLPPGKTLRILSFGYDNLVADLLYIWSIQFYSTYNLKNRFDFIEQIFNTITDLSPAYKDPYSIGGMIMSVEKKDAPMAIRLLEKGARNNPDYWFFLHDAGFYASHYLKDYKKAEELYSRAAAIPSAPAFIKRQQAHWIYMQNNLDEAWRLWEEIYKNSQDSGDILQRDSAFNHLYQIKSDKDRKLLEEKIGEFQLRYHRLPSSLEKLLKTKTIPQLPTDFSGHPYLYDPLTGKVKARRENKWKK